MKNILLNWRVLLLGALLFAFSPGCDTTQGEGAPCNDISDCDKSLGQRCGAEGKCTSETQSCTNSLECGSGNFCKSGSCAPAGCESKEECGGEGSGYICLDNFCIEGCEEKSDCPLPTDVCVNGTCEPEGCSSNESCGLHKECNKDVSPAQCKEAQTCSCNPNNPGMPPLLPGESNTEYCKRVDTGDKHCRFWANQEKKTEEYYCSRLTNRCEIKRKCGIDGDCPGDKICVTGPQGTKECVDGCRTETGSQFKTHRCANPKKCLPHPNPALDYNICQKGCEDNSECNVSIGEACAKNICVKTCQGSTQCDEGLVCRKNDAVSSSDTEVKTCQTCIDNGDCPSTHFCDYDAHQAPREGLCKNRKSCLKDTYGYDGENSKGNHTLENAFVIETLPFEGIGENMPSVCQHHLKNDSNVGNGDHGTGDFFKFKITPNSNKVVSIKLSYPQNTNGTINLDLTLFKKNGANWEEVARSAMPDEQAGSNVRGFDDTPLKLNNYSVREIIEYGVQENSSDLTPVEFYLQVTGDIIDVGYQKYNLEITESTPTECSDDKFDEISPNDTRADATNLMEKQGDFWSAWDISTKDKAETPKDIKKLYVCGNKPDYYKLTLKANYGLAVNLDHESRRGDISIEIYDAAKGESAGAIATAPSQSEFLKHPNKIVAFVDSAPTDRTLIIHVYLRNKAGYNQYSLGIKQKENICIDSFENNDACATGSVENENTFYERNQTPNIFIKNESGTTITKPLNICSDSDFYCKHLFPGQQLVYEVCYNNNNLFGIPKVVVLRPSSPDAKDCNNQLTDKQEQRLTFISSETYKELNSENIGEISPNECLQISTEQAQVYQKYCARVFLTNGSSAEYAFSSFLQGEATCTDDSYNHHTNKTETNPPSAPSAPIKFDRSKALQGQNNLTLNAKICEQTADWYEIELKDGDTVTFDIEFQNAVGDIDAYLYKEGETTTHVASATSEDDNEKLTYKVPSSKGGKYYLVVKAKSEARVTYTVLLTISDGSTTGTQKQPKCPDKYEDNNEKNKATVLTVANGTPATYEDLLICGKNVMGSSEADIDYYAVDVLPGETLTATVTWETSDKLKLEVSSNAKNDNYISTNTTTNNELSYEQYFNGKEKVYVAVTTTSVNAKTPYTLKLEKTAAPACVDDAYHTNPGNHSQDKAVDLTEKTVNKTNVENKLTLCETAGQNEDWFKITVPQDKVLNLFLRTAKTERSPIKSKVTFFDSTNPSTALTNPKVTATEDHLSRGTLYKLNKEGTEKTYYIKVTSENEGRFHYALIWEFTDTTTGIILNFDCPDAFEGNNSIYEAKAIKPGTYENLLLCGDRDNSRFLGSVSKVDSDHYSLSVPPQAKTTVVLKYNGEGNLINFNCNSSCGTPETTGHADDKIVEERTITLTLDNTTGTKFKEFKFVASFMNGKRKKDIFYTLTVTNEYTKTCTNILNPGTTTGPNPDWLKTTLTDAASATAVSGEFKKDLFFCETWDEAYIKLDASSSVEAHIDYYSDTADIDLELLSYDGSTTTSIEKSEETNNQDQINKTGLSALGSGSSYYLKLKPKTKGRTWFTLYIKTDKDSSSLEPFCTDQYEYNNTFLSATKVEFDSTTKVYVTEVAPKLCGEDTDWYYFTPPNNNKETVIALYGPGIYKDEVSVALYDVDDNQSSVTTSTNLVTNDKHSSNKANDSSHWSPKGFEFTINTLKNNKVYALKISHTATVSEPYVLVIGEKAKLINSSSIGLCADLVTNKFSTSSPSAPYNLENSDFEIINYATYCTNKNREESAFNYTIPAKTKLIIDIYTLNDKSGSPTTPLLKIKDILAGIYGNYQTVDKGYYRAEFSNNNNNPSGFQLLIKHNDTYEYFPYFLFIKKEAIP